MTGPIGPFRNRQEAGQRLAEELAGYGEEDVVVIALPRGGVPVAFEIAKELQAPLDVVVVRKVGVPGHEELAMGAVASGGVLVRNDDIISALGIGDDVVEASAEAKRREVSARERAFRGDRETPELAGRTVIVVDDGIATGSTMRASLRALRQSGAERLVVAVPVASETACREMRELADEVLCLIATDQLIAVGQWYLNFDQVSSEEVVELLDAASSVHVGDEQ
ncbi:MAG: phosphoribosyltransferase [Actinobacteria bacterium]|nr:phosphoribosyltransferase [Actinomycetota bacterium]